MIRSYFAQRRLKKRLKAFDDRIEAARAAHKPVAHIHGEKQRFLHEQLRGVV